MPPETIHLSADAKQQLVRLKRRTGIKHWNVLCRWGLCRSLAEPTPVPPQRIPADSNVEMTWRTFAGPWADALWALTVAHCAASGVPTDNETVNQQLRLHIHRGVGYLYGDQSLTDIESLVGLAVV